MGKIPLSISAIEDFRRAKGLTLKELADNSCGRFEIHSIKNLLYGAKRPRLDEYEAGLLADILDVSLEDIVDLVFFQILPIPFRLNLLLNELYSEHPKDIGVIYERMIEENRKRVGFQNLLGQVSLLFPHVSNLYDSDWRLCIGDACSAIVKSCSIVPLGTLYSSDLGIGSQELDSLIFQLAHTENSPTGAAQQSIFLFLYTLVLFESLFLEELVASAVQDSLFSSRQTVMQYYSLAAKAEKLKTAFIDLVINKNAWVEAEVDMVETGALDKVHEGIIIMLGACQECNKHLRNPTAASQYVNRRNFNGLLSCLIQTAGIFGIKITVLQLEDIFTTRFGQRIMDYRLLHKALAPEEYKRRKPTSWGDGFLTGYFLS